MSSKLRLSIMSLATAAALAATATPAVAGGIVDPAPIGPKQYFDGYVNNSAGHAVIKVTCISPLPPPNAVGHPVAGQSVKALPTTISSSTSTGYTGTAATSIVVSLTPLASTGVPLVLHDWAVPLTIPTSLNVPCTGTFTATFNPAPTSATAHPSTVVVTFVPVS